jgi:hypothetical protein
MDQSYVTKKRWEASPTDCLSTISDFARANNIRKSFSRSSMRHAPPTAHIDISGAMSTVGVLKCCMWDGLETSDTATDVQLVMKKSQLALFLKMKPHAGNFTKSAALLRKSSLKIKGLWWS